MSTTELPSIFRTNYSTCKRSRRSNNNIVPFRYRNTFLKCIEFPEGVYINKEGIPDPEIKYLSDNDIIDDDDDFLSDDDFEKLPVAKRQKVLSKIKGSIKGSDIKQEEVQIPTKEYINHMKGDTEYIPESESESESEDEVEPDSSDDEDFSEQEGEDSQSSDSESDEDDDDENGENDDDQ